MEVFPFPRATQPAAWCLCTSRHAAGGREVLCVCLYHPSIPAQPAYLWGIKRPGGVMHKRGPWHIKPGSNMCVCTFCADTGLCC